ILRIELFEPNKVWTAVLNDADQGYPYLKRFQFEASAKRQRFIGENPASELIALSDAPGARFKVEFEPVEGVDMVREPLEILSPEFIAVKSFKAKGKRLTTFSVAAISELEPAEVEIPEEEVEELTDSPEEEPVEPEISDDELRDTLNGQERLF
ncbi:MAG: DNA gyrase/topoisomerase IV subunit A, partial [Muribaculaceae bacterium]|nr:DNA gyrase/topoisomerase IV subunit A [Muribaculaceae bacterium]